jgi:hypothetical protein
MLLVVRNYTKHVNRMYTKKNAESFVFKPEGIHIYHTALSAKTSGASNRP